MASTKLTDKERAEIDHTLLTGGNLPSGIRIDFSQNPPYSRIPDAELAAIEKSAAAERARAEALTGSAAVVPDDASNG